MWREEINEGRYGDEGNRNTVKYETHQLHEEKTVELIQAFIVCKCSYSYSPPIVKYIMYTQRWGRV